MNKKGFTIVEIIISISIVLVVGIVSFFIFNNRNNPKKLEIDYKEALKLGALVYLENPDLESNKNELSQTGGKTYIKLEKLIKEGLIDENKFKKFLSEENKNLCLELMMTEEVYELSDELVECPDKPVEPVEPDEPSGECYYQYLDGGTKYALLYNKNSENKDIYIPNSINYTDLYIWEDEELTTMYNVDEDFSKIEDECDYKIKEVSFIKVKNDGSISGIMDFDVSRSLDNKYSLSYVFFDKDSQWLEGTYRLYLTCGNEDYEVSCGEIIYTIKNFKHADDEYYEPNDSEYDECWEEYLGCWKASYPGEGIIYVYDKYLNTCTGGIKTFDRIVPYDDYWKHQCIEGPFGG